MKRIALFLMMMVWVRAYEYNTFLLNSQASTYPKLISFDRNVAKNIEDGIIDFFILYEHVDAFVAATIEERIKEEFPRGIRNMALQPHTLNVREFFADKSIVRKIDALFVLKLEPRFARRVARAIERKNIYSFVYDKRDLRFGFLFNVTIERNIVVYINKKVLLENDFDFVEELYSISKFVE